MTEMVKKLRQIDIMAPNADLRLLVLTVGVLLGTFVIASSLFAGPPFMTDDPEPVEFKHGELYVASIYSNDKDGRSGTAPHIEANYGILPNTQLHLILPLAYNSPREGSTQYGLGDIEIGVKFRFIQETDLRPQVGTFPQVELPTGSRERGLGEGRARVFFPLWVQKSWGPWTAYGGGGYWYNPGPDKKDYWFTGWLLQREFFKTFIIGGEIFYASKSEATGSSRVGFNLGTIVDVTGNHHLLFSAGRDLHGNNLFSMYAGYLFTFGPVRRIIPHRQPRSE